MIDLVSVVIGVVSGMFIGTFICIIAGVFNVEALTEQIDNLEEENEALRQKNINFLARDARGRFTGGKNDG